MIARRRWTAIVAACAAVLTSACRAGQQATDPSPTDEAVRAWLLCDECLSGEFEAVMVLRGDAVPPLAGQVRGLDANLRDEARAAFEADFPPGLDPQDVADAVDVMVDNFDAGVRIRASTALGGLGARGVEPALDSLRAILDTPAGLRDDVVRATERALAQATQAPFDGTIDGGGGPASAAVLDTLLVRPGGTAWTAAATARVAGAPFGDSLVVGRWAPDSLGLLVLGDPAVYLLSLMPTGGADTVQTTLTVSGFPVDPPGLVGGCDPADIACVESRAFDVSAGPFPHTLYAYLTSRRNGVGPADTAMYVRLAASAGTQFETEVEFFDPNGPAPGVRWLECGTLRRVAGFGTQPGPPVPTAIVVPAGQCRLLEVSMPAGSPDTYVKVRVDTPDDVATIGGLPADLATAAPSVRLIAIPLTASGAALIGRTVVWTSEDTTIATVAETPCEPTGPPAASCALVTRVTDGAVNIRATSDGASAATTITFVP